MTDDPAGYYAVLDVDPAATPEAIAAAFRRKARVLHPDVPETGNADAFIAAKLAYDILSDADRRAAYDRAATAPLADTTRRRAEPRADRACRTCRSRCGPVWAGWSVSRRS